MVSKGAILLKLGLQGADVGKYNRMRQAGVPELAVQQAIRLDVLMYSMYSTPRHERARGRRL